MDTLAWFLIALCVILLASVPVMIDYVQSVARARMRDEFRSEIATLRAEIESLRDYIESRIGESGPGRPHEAVEGEATGGGGALVHRALPYEPPSTV